MLIKKGHQTLPTNTAVDHTYVYLYEKSSSTPVLSVSVGVLEDKRGYMRFTEVDTGFLEFKLIHDNEFPRYILDFLGDPTVE